MSKPNKKQKENTWHILCATRKTDEGWASDEN